MLKTFNTTRILKYFSIATCIFLVTTAASVKVVKMGGAMGYSGLVVESYDSRTPVNNAQAGLYDAISGKGITYTVANGSFDGSFGSLGRQTNILWASEENHTTKSKLMFNGSVNTINQTTQVVALDATPTEAIADSLVVTLNFPTDNGPYTLSLTNEGASATGGKGETVKMLIDMNNMNHNLVVTDRSGRISNYAFNMKKAEWPSPNYISTILTQ